MDHPDYVFNSEKNPNQRITEKLWRESLKKALALKQRPWPQGPPDLESDVECIYDAREASLILKDFTRKGGPISFDYECNCLKPEWPKSRIVSASVCWRGERTIAFAMGGEADEPATDAEREELNADQETPEPELDDEPATDTPSLADQALVGPVITEPTDQITLAELCNTYGVVPRIARRQLRAAVAAGKLDHDARTGWTFLRNQENIDAIMFLITTRKRG
jgi:hypothetical protein